MSNKQPQTLEQLAAQYQPRKRRAKAAAPAAPATENKPPLPTHPPVPAFDEPAPATDKAAQLAALLTELAGSKAAPVDADTVRRIVAEELANSKATPVTINMAGPAKQAATVKAGAHPLTQRVVATLMAGENVYLVGPSGSGKTTLAKHAAEALEVAFHATGAVFEPYALLGFKNAHGEYVRTPFRDAYEYGGVFLWDEIDASNPEALAVFNMALANGACPFPDGLVERHKDFHAVAGANTTGMGADGVYTARQAVDGATLDRFVTYRVEYSDTVEQAMARRAAAAHGLSEKFADAVAASVQDYRQRAQHAGQQHLVTPRATERLVKLAGIGLPLDDALESTLYVHAGEDARRQEAFHLMGASWPV